MQVYGQLIFNKEIKSLKMSKKSAFKKWSATCQQTFSIIGMFLLPNIELTF